MDLRIEDLPFEEREPLALLGIVRGREAPDLDYGGYGFARIDVLDLAGADDRTTEIRDALVLALHTPDDPPSGKTLEIELEVELEGEEVSVIAPLQAFLERRAASIVEKTEVVLALCNPRGVQPERPSWLTGGRRLHWAKGDVIAWLDVFDDGRERIRLQAESWHTMR